MIAPSMKWQKEIKIEKIMIIVIWCVPFDENNKIMSSANESEQ